VLIKVFSLRFDALAGEFDDNPVREFTKDKEIIQVQDHLLVRNEIPYLILVIKYYPYRKEAEAHAKAVPPNENRSNDAWKKELNEADMSLFNLLRDWRSERCKNDGIPPYLIFTNQQLANIAKQKPNSLSDLAKIDGVGSGKCERYGEGVLSITQVQKDG